MRTCSCMLWSACHGSMLLLWSCPGWSSWHHTRARSEPGTQGREPGMGAPTCSQLIFNPLLGST